ncbi:hypothetical protein [Marinoscillum sp.]|uniref:hypothetical protein n=1 Tax=Marinoscillum sp. TaxID=2024838 RepID=UPI003BABAA19
MNRLLILLTFTIFGLTLNAQKVKESYHPKVPFEQRTDTTISATDISWIFRSISDEHITQEYQDGNKLFKYYYRDTELNIRTVNFELTFNKMNFQDSIGFEPGVFTMNFLGFEGFDELTSELQFFLTINKPDTDWTYPIYLYVNLNGSSRFELPTFDEDY